MRDAGELTEATLERIAARYGMQVRQDVPLQAADGGPLTGSYRILAGPELDKIVVVNLDIDDGEQPNQIDLLYAFSPSNNLAPHLGLEWSRVADVDGDGSTQLWILVDLLPRLDLAVNPGYIDEVYEPLTPILADAWTIPGAELVRIPARRGVGFSPWRFSAAAPESESAALDTIVDRYVDHWMAIVSGGVGASVDPLASDPARLVQHDRYHREGIFDEMSTPHWMRVNRLLGQNDAAELRQALRSQEIR